MKRVGSAAALTLVPHAQAFGGFYLDVTGITRVVFPGRDNIPHGSTEFTLGMSLVPNFTGAPGARTTLFEFSPGAYELPYGGMAFTINSTGKFVMTGGTKANGLAYGDNLTSTNAITFVNNQRMDLIVTVKTNQLKIYTAQHGNPLTLLETMTMNTNLEALDRMAITCLGFSDDSNNTTGSNNKLHYNEIFFDSVALNVPTVFGTRTGFYPATLFEGYLNTSPTPHQVDTGVQWYSNGVLMEGDSDDPDPSDVRRNKVYDNGTKIGTLDVPVPPAPNLVLLGVDRGDGVLGTRDDAVESDVAKNKIYAAGTKRGTRDVITNFIGRGELGSGRRRAVLEAE